MIRVRGERVNKDMIHEAKFQRNQTCPLGVGVKPQSGFASRHGVDLTARVRDVGWPPGGEGQMGRRQPCLCMEMPFLDTQGSRASRVHDDGKLGSVGRQQDVPGTGEAYVGERPVRRDPDGDPAPGQVVSVAREGQAVNVEGHGQPRGVSG
jgi:hypothetical protein